MGGEFGNGKILSSILDLSILRPLGRNDGIFRAAE